MTAAATDLSGVACPSSTCTGTLTRKEHTDKWACTGCSIEIKDEKDWKSVYKQHVEQQFCYSIAVVSDRLNK